MGIGTREGRNTHLMKLLFYTQKFIYLRVIWICVCQVDIYKRTYWVRSFLEKLWLLEDAILGEKVTESGAEDEVAPEQTHFLRKKKERNWSGLCRQTCLFSCWCVRILWWLPQDARAMPMLFKWEGEASEHRQYSLKAKHSTSVWREGAPQCCEQKVPLNSEKGHVWGHWEPSPLVVLLWELLTGSVVTLNWLRQWEADGSQRIRVDTQGSFSWWAGLRASGRLLLEDLQKCLRKTWPRWSGSKGTWVIVVKGTLLVATA